MAFAPRPGPWGRGRNRLPRFSVLFVETGGSGGGHPGPARSEGESEAGIATPSASLECGWRGWGWGASCERAGSQSVEQQEEVEEEAYLEEVQE